MLSTSIRLGLIVHSASIGASAWGEGDFWRSIARTSGFHQPLRGRMLPRSRGRQTTARPAARAAPCQQGEIR